MTGQASSREGTSVDREARFIQIMRGLIPGPPSPEEGPGDDCAALGPQGPRGRRVLTTDALVEGVHFVRAHPPRWLGYKTLAVNTSDVAAMGARPEGFVLAAALPPDTPDAWWEALARGLAEAARDAGCALVGGDVVGSPGPIMLTVTAWGATPTPALLRRDQARPGQDVWLAGTVGRSRRGLAGWLQRPHDAAAWPAPDAHRGLEGDACLEAHLRPTPPLGAGPAALAAGATAGMDISDGLVRDATRLGQASGVVVVVDARALPPDAALGGDGGGPAPVHADAGGRGGGSAREQALERLRGGEDYALVVTAPRQAAEALRRAGLHRVGWVRAAQDEAPGFEARWGAEVLSRRALDRGIFDHFPRGDGAHAGPGHAAGEASKLAGAQGPS